MPKLKDIALGWCARRLAESYAHCSRASAAGRNAELELNFLRRLLDDKDLLIQRLKETDARRSGLYLKLRTELKRKRRECKDARAIVRNQKRILAKRRHNIMDLSQRLRAHRRKQPLPEILVAGLHCLTNATSSGLGNAGSAADWIFARLGEVFGRVIWRHWMRLGVLRQYPPRPLRPEKLPSVKSRPSLPRIGIVTPSFNQRPYLEATLKSVLDQAYSAVDYIVMDGGSSDGSQDIIRRYEDRLAHWQSAPDGGQAAAIHAGFDHTDAEVLAWLNSDDLLMPGALGIVGDYFRRHPEVDVVYGHRAVVNRNGNEVGRWILPPHDGEFLLWADFIPQETCFWRRSVYERAGGLDPSFQFALDWDLFLRFQAAGAKFVRIPFVLGAFRLHEDQKNATTLLRHGYPEMAKLRKRELDGAFCGSGMAHRLVKAQAQGLACLFLSRLGIRV